MTNRKETSAYIKCSVEGPGAPIVHLPSLLEIYDSTSRFMSERLFWYDNPFNSCNAKLNAIVRPVVNNLGLPRGPPR